MWIIRESSELLLAFDEKPSISNYDSNWIILPLKARHVLYGWAYPEIKESDDPIWKRFIPSNYIIPSKVRD